MSDNMDEPFEPEETESFVDAGQPIFTKDMFDTNAGQITVAPDAGTTINLPSSPNTGQNWVVTSTGTGGNTLKYDSGMKLPDDIESPAEVLGDHLNYLNRQKDSYEGSLKSLTEQYSRTEDSLNEVEKSIKETEEAIGLLGKAGNKGEENNDDD